MSDAKEIVISTGKGTARVVPVLVVDVWAVHRLHSGSAADARWFKVTHVPTGVAIPTDYSEEVARDVANYLATTRPGIGAGLRLRDRLPAHDLALLQSTDKMFRELADAGLGIEIEELPDAD